MTEGNGKYTRVIGEWGGSTREAQAFQIHADVCDLWASDVGCRRFLRMAVLMLQVDGQDTEILVGSINKISCEDCGCDSGR